MARYTAVDPMARLISMMGQDQEEEQDPNAQLQQMQPEQPEQGNSQELIARLQQISGAGGQRSQQVANSIKPNLAAPAARRASAGQSGQLDEIAKWGQYSMAPRPKPQVAGTGGGTVQGTSDFSNFLRAIAAQESGGRYGAVNKSSGALGKYQIMPMNISSWSKQALGRSISSSQFLHNPRLQEQIAQYMLRRYYQKYGARGAAEAWYGGPGSIGKGYVRGYSSSILRRMGL